MRLQKMRKIIGISFVAVILIIGIAGCGSDAGEPAEEVSSITILIPEDPVGFNGLVTDTGYEQLLGELIMLSVTDIDPYGEVYPELALELPTLENGGVEFDEDYWTMNVTWKSGMTFIGQTVNKSRWMISSSPGMSHLRSRPGSLDRRSGLYRYGGKDR